MKLNCAGVHAAAVVLEGAVAYSHVPIEHIERTLVTIGDMIVVEDATLNEDVYR